MPRAVTDDGPELDTDLPPLDGGSDEREVETDIGIDISTNEHVGLDDDVATDLDVGIALDEPSDRASDEPDELVLDIAELLDRAEERESGDDSDFGPADFDPSIGIDELADAGPGGAEEGIEDAPDAGADEELPELDGDDESESELRGLELEVLADEELPQSSERPWLERALGEQLGACIALDMTGSGWVAATGDDIVWLSDERLSSMPANASRVASLCRVHADGVLYASVTGELLRRDDCGAPPVSLSGWRVAARVAEDDPSTLELCRLRGSSTGVLAKTSSGGLLVSHDAGSSFRSIELHGKVVALPRSAEAGVVLVRHGHDAFLLSAVEAGQSFRRIELDAAALAVATGETTLVATAGPVIALADAGRGLCISADGGEHFVRSAGCLGATALAVGRSAGRWLVAAALHREVEDVTYLVVVDAESGTAERVAEVAGAASSDGLDSARIASLCFDEQPLRLWAAGSFGVTSWSPEQLAN